LNRVIRGRTNKLSGYSKKQSKINKITIRTRFLCGKLNWEKARAAMVRRYAIIRVVTKWILRSVQHNEIIEGGGKEREK